VEIRQALAAIQELDLARRLEEYYDRTGLDREIHPEAQRRFLPTFLVQRELYEDPVVLAPNAAAGAQIVPGPQDQAEDAAAVPVNGVGRSAPRCGRLSWAQLLGRVFQFDVTVCPACGGHKKGSLPQANSEETGRQTGLHHRGAHRLAFHPHLPGGRRPAGASAAGGASPARSPVGVRPATGS